MLTKKRLFFTVFGVFLLWTVVCGLMAQGVEAAIPHLINYQGKLTNSGGTALTGSYSINFRIYDAQTAGTLLWEETHSGVVVDKGLFSVLLGSVTALNLPFDKSYYLEIKVGSEVMSPRQMIASSAYAMRAAVAESVVNLDPGEVGTKKVDETNIGDWKAAVFKAASGKLEYEDHVRMKTGTYVGNGQPTTSITGVGFRPKFLIIWAVDNMVTNAWLKTEHDKTTYCRKAASAEVCDDVIRSLDADGFTIGRSKTISVNGKIYVYVAFGH